MSNAISSLMNLVSFTPEKFEKLFSLSEALRGTPPAVDFPGRTAALLFFEPSTRTRMSFESACFRCGLGPLVFDGGPMTSLEKGETVEDSILNVVAMDPTVVVVRCGDSVPLDQIAKKIPMPLINAGWGKVGHPTQALLDVATLKRKWGQLSGKKLLIVGDIKHSRVAQSHFELLPLLGVKVGICGPEQFLQSHAGVEVFRDLTAALKWADAVMALRVQLERHSDSHQLSPESYRGFYGLTAKSLQNLKREAWILHPGPVNHGVEIDTEIFQDPRSLIFEQVRSGVYVREAVIRMSLRGELR